MREQTNVRKALLLAVLLVAMMSAASLPAMAKEDKMTGKYLSLFQNSAKWVSNPVYTKPEYGYLKWDPGFSFTKKRIGNIDASTVCTGDCASFVEKVDNNVKTKNWKQGMHVLSGGVIPGTAIATLDNNGYISGGHSAIFVNYVYSNGKIIGFSAWDQNYHGDNAIGRHTLTNGASSRNSNQISGSSFPG